MRVSVHSGSLLFALSLAFGFPNPPTPCLFSGVWAVPGLYTLVLRGVEVIGGRGVVPWGQTITSLLVNEETFSCGCHGNQMRHACTACKAAYTGLTDIKDYSWPGTAPRGPMCALNGIGSMCVVSECGGVSEALLQISCKDRACTRGAAAHASYHRHLR